MNKARFNTLILLLLIGVLSFFTLYRIPAADNWLNLATGKYVLKELTWPVKDVFSYTARDSSWNSTQWFILAVFYIVYLPFKMKGLYLLRTILLLSVFSIIFSHCRIRNLNPLISFIFIIISVLFAQPYYYFDIRAYLISYLFIVIYLFLLEKRRLYRKTFPLWLFPVINCIWVNSHSAFLMGLFIIFTYFLDDFFSKKRRKYSIFLLKVFILTFLSSFINPYTYKVLLYPFRLGYEDGFWQKFLIEWNPPDLFGSNISFTIFWVICSFFLVSTIKKISLRDFLIWAVFSYLSFKAVRHITLFCIIISPIFVKHLEIFFRRYNRKIRYITFYIKKLINKRFYLKIFILLLCLTIYIRTVWAIFTVDFSLEKDMFPYYSVRFIRNNNLPGRLYNPYEWGGYIMWTLYPEKTVFWDGRADVVYTKEICEAGYLAMKGEDISVFDRYNINIVLCNKINEALGMNLPSVLLNDPENWCLIYSDENSYIFIRNNLLNKGIINKFDKGNLALPDSPMGNYYQGSVLFNKGDYKKALIFFDASIKLNQKLIEAWISRGALMIKLGNLKEAENCFLKVVSLDPKYPLVHYNLGLIYEIQGDLLKARKEFEEELQINDYTPAREELNKLNK